MACRRTGPLCVFESRRKKKPVNSPTSLGSLVDAETHGEFSYIGPACCVRFRRKFTGWNAHASKGIADVFG